jgi:electron transfer flavoprotein beta subunit
VSDKVFAGSDTWATSYTLSRTIQKIGRFDIIICGKQAIDGDTAQVGPGIAAFLDVPQITFVKKIEEIATINQHGHNESRATNDERRLIRAERMTEEGYDIIESPLPCVITVVKEINEPRLPSLKGKMRAKKIEIKRLEAKDLDADPDSLGLKGSPTKVVKIFTPPPRKGGQILQGEVKEVCGKLLELLKGEIS